MQEFEVTKAHMEALKALADTNMKVSEAKNTLKKLEETETEYLLSREKKVVERVENALLESKKLVEDTVKNYELVEEYVKTISIAGEMVVKATDALEARDAARAQYVAEWEESCKNSEQLLAEQKKVIQLGHVLLNSEKESIESQKRLLAAKERKLEDKRQTLERAIARLKKGKI